MYRSYILAVLSILQSASSWAQDDADRWKSSCVVAPIFHCVQHLDRGGAIGYFGYNLQCPEDAPAEAEVYVDISEDNLFSPDSKDRGQPKIFVSGEHTDEFEVEFSMSEVTGGSGIYWSVLEQTVMVDFSKTNDQFLDCASMSQ